jgi:hypothetical protein
MSEMPYHRCPICVGSRIVLDETVKRIVPCPCTRGSTPGWAPVGVTMGQLERLVERETARQQARCGGGVTPASRALQHLMVRE